MIESICSKEAEELQHDRVGQAIRMPKNIRQIGQMEGNKKIYMEDYVMTYIRQLAVKNVGKYQLAVLLGKYVSTEESRNILISGAVEIKDILFEENITFSNEVWTSIYDDIKKYFSDVEIVGWMLAKAGLPMAVDERIKKIHLDNFAGQDKTLLLYDSVEREEAFYLFDGNYFMQQPGYYIYYEKNEEMQSYMIDQKGPVSEEAQYDDRAIKEIRSIISAKKEVPQEKKLVNLFYAASTVLAAVVLVIGVTMLNNYDKMKDMEETLNLISANLNEKESQEDKKTEVDTMTGNVTTIKQEKVVTEDEPAVTSEETAAVPKKKAGAKTETVKNTQVYVVKKGDTLASISKKVYKSTKYISKILEANEIEDQDKIYVGQKLIMP